MNIHELMEHVRSEAGLVEGKNEYAQREVRRAIATMRKQISDLERDLERENYHDALMTVDRIDKTSMATLRSDLSVLAR